MFVKYKTLFSMPKLFITVFISIVRSVFGQILIFCV